MNFEELESVLTLREECRKLNGVSVRTEVNLQHHHRDFPVLSFHFGQEGKDAPCLMLLGGVHGLEKIGTLILLSYLDTLIQLLRWDQTLHQILSKIKLVIVPIVNPVGMYLGRRSNGNSVDLMRNAPIDALVRPTFMVGGQRFSQRIPWYRGKKGHAMEAESQAIFNLAEREFFDRPFTIALDVHSGFGLRDRIWFPYAHTRQPFDQLQYVYMLKKILDNSYPNNIYTIEPQIRHYITNGDLWDYTFKEFLKAKTTNGVFLPLTLEIGSWSWIKKNPKQIFDILGLYNPIMPHRRQRAIRRHLWLIDFLIRLVYSHKSWTAKSDEQMNEIRHLAINHWY